MNTINEFTFLGLIFFVALLGSVHCSFMCCPLQGFQKGLLRFQLGRFLGYFLVWTLLKLFSWSLFLKFGKPVFLTVAFIFTLLVLLRGLQLLGMPIPHLQFFRAPMLQTKWLPSSIQSILAGVGLSMRGCGWMWSFVALATAENHILLSFSRLVVFYLGTMAPFALTPLLPKSWGLNEKGRGIALLAMGFMQITMIFENPLSRLYNIQSLLLGSEVKHPLEFLCGLK